MTALRLAGPALVALVTATMAFAAPHVLATGSWTKKSHKAAGSWRIVETEDGTRDVVLSSDFKTRNAPDLKLFLSPKPLSELNGKNATEGAVLIAPLARNKGAQTYALPEGVELDDYATIIIHCEQYSKLWAGAPLASSG